MAFPRAAGSPDYTSSGTSKFIPELWSAKLIENFYNTTVFGSIANTDYEGEITKYGDKVNIRTTPDITVRPYSKGQNLVLERPEKPSFTLEIDQGDYFATIEDDVDKVQSDINLLDTWSKDASEKMKQSIDTKLLAFTATSSRLIAANTGTTAGKISQNINIGAAGSPVQLTKVNVLDYIVNLGVILDEQSAPQEGRWLVLPAWACGLIKKSDLKDASLSGDGTSILRNGRIGMIDRFTIYMSNNIYTSGSEFYPLFGHKMGLTFATQMTEMETLRAESTFGTIVRGLQVYGYQLTKPETIGRMVVTQ